jgi:hypothetical protein
MEEACGLCHAPLIRRDEARGGGGEGRNSTSSKRWERPLRKAMSRWGGWSVEGRSKRGSRRCLMGPETEKKRKRRKNEEAERQRRRRGGGGKAEEEEEEAKEVRRRGGRGQE